MGKTLFELFKALFNATLILLALCLFLLWKGVSTFDHITDQIVGIVAPVQTELQESTATLRHIKSRMEAVEARLPSEALAEVLDGSLGAAGGAADRAAAAELAALTAELAQLNIRFEEVQARVDSGIAQIKAMPETLRDTALPALAQRGAEAAAGAAAATVTQCLAPLARDFLSPDLLLQAPDPG